MDDLIVDPKRFFSRLTTIIVIVGIIGVIATAAFIQFRQDFRTRASENFSCDPVRQPDTTVAMTRTEKLSAAKEFIDLSQQLTQLFYGLTPVTAGEKAVSAETLKSIAQERKRVLLLLMKEDPASALDNMFSPSQQGVLAKRMNNCIEEAATLQGVLQTAQNGYVLKLGNNQTIMLYFTQKNHPTFADGTKVTVKGEKLDNSMVLDTHEKFAIIDSVSAVSVAKNSNMKSSSSVTISTIAPTGSITQKLPIPSISPVPTQPPTLTTSASSAQAGNSITVLWNYVADATNRDWIDIYKPGASVESGTSSGWIYTSSCNGSVGDAIKQVGSCPFVIPSNLLTGLYELRLYSNDGSSLIAKSNTITVNGTSANSKSYPTPTTTKSSTQSNNSTTSNSSSNSNPTSSNNSSNNSTNSQPSTQSSPTATSAPPNQTPSATPTSIPTNSPVTTSPPNTSFLVITRPADGTRVTGPISITVIPTSDHMDYTQNIKIYADGVVIKDCNYPTNVCEQYYNPAAGTHSIYATGYDRAKSPAFTQTTVITITR